jgi:Zn-dependent protease/CBS domain-containing protein
MTNSLKIGSIRGIPILVHVTFLLVLPFIAYAFGRSFVAAAQLARVPPASLAGSQWLWGFLVALALFASVLVHEIAHSLYALSHGIPVKSITLLMIGGVSEMRAEPRQPGTEAVMALVGPLTSIVLGLGFLGLYAASAGLRRFDLRFGLFYLGQLNLILGIFNLLPAFPMDGGRILRGVLARRRGPVRATQIAANVGKGFAVLFGIWGFLTGNILLMIIAFFVFVGAEGEQHAVIARAVLGDLHVGEVMARQAQTVSPRDSLFEVAERMLHDGRLSFAVADGGNLVGIITLDDIERVPLDRRRQTPVGDVMAPHVSVSSTDRVADALQVFAQTRVPVLPVVDGGRLVGTLTAADVGRALRLRELAESQRSRGGGPPRRLAQQRS